MKPFLILSNVVCSYLCLHLLIYLAQAQQDQQQMDSNKVLNDFIWDKIISADKGKSSKGSSAEPPMLPLVTIPYKPGSSSSTVNSSPISRRSSYSSQTQSSLTSLPSTSSSTYTRDRSNSDVVNIANKFLPQESQNSATKMRPGLQIKSSYSGSENGKNYFSSAMQQQQSQTSQTESQLSKSLYDLMPMPTYGYSKQQPLDNDLDQNNIYPSKRTVEIVPMIQNGQKYDQTMEPQIIEVAPDDQPIQVVFRSTSARVQVKQIHTPLKPEEVETTRTEEEPQRVMHQLLRPVIQEVLEVIQPYRRVTQEVRPVVEEIHTIVAKAAPSNGQQQNQQPSERGMYNYNGSNQQGHQPSIGGPFGQHYVAAGSSRSYTTAKKTKDINGNYGNSLTNFV